MIVLRPYQKRTLAEVLAAFDTTRRVLLQAPTGSGKTVIGAAFVEERSSTTARRVLWLAHRFELLTQARAALLAAGLPRVGILSGTLREDTEAPVLVAMIDSARARDQLPAFDLVVIDEAHRTEAGSYQKILARMPGGAEVLGLTATPERLDGKGLGATYGALVRGPSQRKLAAGKFLARPVTFTLPGDKVKAAIAHVKMARGDYQVGGEAGLSRAMEHPDLIAEVVEHAAKWAQGQQTIVFAVTRVHGRALCAAFVASGRRAAFVDALTPAKERARLTAALRSGEIEVLVNVDVLTEGFDAPEVTCVVMARPTKSLVRYLQYAGRAARPYGAAKATILDHAGNWYAHGEVDADRAWSLDGRPKSDGSPHAKRCEACGAVMACAAKTCPECGAQSLVNPHEEWERRAEAMELERVSARTCSHEGCDALVARAVVRSCPRHTPQALAKEARRIAVCEHCGGPLHSARVRPGKRFCKRQCYEKRVSVEEVGRPCKACGVSFLGRVCPPCKQRGRKKRVSA